MPSKLEMKRQWLPIRILPIMTSCWLRPHHDIICGDFVMRSKSKFGQVEWVSSADGCVFRGKSGVIEAAIRWDKKDIFHLSNGFSFMTLTRGIWDAAQACASMRKLQKGCIGKRVTVYRGICHGQDMPYGLWSSISYKSPMDWWQKSPWFWRKFQVSQCTRPLPWLTWSCLCLEPTVNWVRSGELSWKIPWFLSFSRVFYQSQRDSWRFISSSLPSPSPHRCHMISPWQVDNDKKLRHGTSQRLEDHRAERPSMVYLAGGNFPRPESEMTHGPDWIADPLLNPGNISTLEFSGMLRATQLMNIRPNQTKSSKWRIATPKGMWLQQMHT